MRLVATPCVGAGEFEELSGQRARLGHTADEQHASLSSVSTSAWKITWSGATRSSVWSKSGRASAARPARAYATPKMEAAWGKKRGMLAVWQSARPRSSAGIAWRMSPWRRASNPTPISAPAILKGRSSASAIRIASSARPRPSAKPPVRPDNRPHNHGRPQRAGRTCQSSHKADRR